MASITIIGAGAWGTALAMTACRAGNFVRIWAREDEVVHCINNQHKNPFLPDVMLPTTLKATGSLEEALANAETVLLVAPAQFTRSVFTDMLPYFKSNQTLVLCAKGIELKTGLLLSEVIHSLKPDLKPAVLSGPNFAAEVARECPTAVTIASETEGEADRLCQMLRTDRFRPYSSMDIITPQVCGSVKNVMAIASGIIEGCSLGDNARAALIARGLTEMKRLAVALGGLPESILGLSGVGDLVLTASSKQSRNFSFGFEIGEVGAAEPVLKTCLKTVEGVPTAAAVMERAQKLSVDMPICAAVNAVLYHQKPIREAIFELLARPLRSEK